MIARSTRRAKLVAASIALTSAIACGAPPARPGGVASSPPPSAGDAARIICEGECRRDARCGGSEQPAQCFARCTTLPVRSPPVWRADWATQIAACFDRTPCGHDRDEACVTQTSFRTNAAATCNGLAGGSPRAMAMCGVLDGLAPDADRRTDECLRSTRDLQRCSPEYDWK